MFTGIVEELGTVESVTLLGSSARLTVRAKVVTADVGYGDSIAVNGVCLTVVDGASGSGRLTADSASPRPLAVDGDLFAADVMPETLSRTALGGLRAGDRVNLERAATLGTRLGGHLVQGHVDGVGVILSREPGDRWETVRFSLAGGHAPSCSPLARYVVEKGSITVDGVSLTVAAVGPDWFEVGLIPTTLALTTLGFRDVGEPVNLEVDVIAKYVERLLEARR